MASKTAAQRSSSEERRGELIDAAVTEFATNGFHATSTTAIAKRAGISQPYVYALFPNKHELFLAANAEVVERIRGAFADAARGLESTEERLHAMGEAYIELLEARPEVLANADESIRHHEVVERDHEERDRDDREGQDAVALHFRLLVIG